MFEKLRAEIRILANIADAQRLDAARDYLRKAEYEFEQRDRQLKEMHEQTAKLYSSAPYQPS